MSERGWLEQLEKDLSLAMTGERPEVRRDCAFCGRERTPHDDNHDDSCPYWDFFGPGSA